MQTEIVVKAGVLPHLAKLLKSPKPNIVKEAAWTASSKLISILFLVFLCVNIYCCLGGLNHGFYLFADIAAGTSQQITEVINAGLVPLIVEIMKCVSNLTLMFFLACFDCA